MWGISPNCHGPVEWEVRRTDDSCLGVGRLVLCTAPSHPLEDLALFSEGHSRIVDVHQVPAAGYVALNYFVPRQTWLSLESGLEANPRLLPDGR